MPTSGEGHVKFRPRGVSDTASGENSSPGAMISLKDLISDPSTPACFICRPANTPLMDFTAWGESIPAGTVGAISVAYQVGNIIFGMVGITSGSFIGLDYPFAYDTVGAAFLAIASVTTAKCPTSQALTGAWTPPQMTLTGIDLVVTHVGFPGGGGAFFGWFDVTTPSVPTWNIGNTATNALPSVPIACATFNNRTRFACGSTAYYTDTLALTMTGATQSQTVGDYTPITCFAPLPTSSSALNIAQGILVFKLSTVSLITGDPVTTNLALNQISSSVGTAAPRSAVSTPEGVFFMSNDGVRSIDFFGELSEPNEDLAMPFIYAVQPSRVCASFNSDIYRVCTQNGNKPGSPYEDYWYNISKKAWTGPHSFRYDVAVTLSNDFVLASNSILGKMWNSYVVQGQDGAGSTFVENGVQMTWNYTPSPMTDLDNIYANAVLRSTIEIAAPSSGQTYNFTAQDENGTALASGFIMEPSNQAVWGAFNWGGAKWGASTSDLIPITIPWNQAVVFNKLSIIAIGNSALGFKISTLHNAYKRLNYLLN